MYVLIAGCSKKPLNSMTIGQVRQSVFDWDEGKLPEQQVEGADEIRKELDVLEKQLEEQEVKNKDRLELLQEEMPDCDNKWGELVEQADEKMAEYRRSDISQKEYDKLYSELSNERTRLMQECREQRKTAEEKCASLKREIDVQRSEFYDKKIAPLKERLKPDKSVDTFYKVFGKPKDKSLVGDRYYFRYRCKDGLVILEIHASSFDYDEVAIMDVSVL